MENKVENQNFGLMTLLGGRSGKLIDCTHVITPQTFSFTSCFEGSEETTFKD